VMAFLPEKAAEAVDSDDDEVDDEEEEEDDEEDVPEPPPVTRTGGRQSVSAEAYGDWNKVKTDFVAPVYEKTDAQVQRIRGIVEKSFIFSNVEEKQLEVLLKAMNKVELKAEEKIITEGDSGDFLFILDDGELICFKEKIGEGTVLKTCVGGDIFGELALLYNAPRAASVKAKAPCLLWKLDRDTFNNIHKVASEKSRKLAKTFLKKVPLLESFRDDQMASLSDVLVLMKYKSGEEILKQGEAGDTFYIVEDGTLAASKDGTQVMKYAPGDVFGELALLSGSAGIRAATVKATSDCRLLTLKRDAFKRMLGNLESVLLEKAGAYK